MEIDMLDRLQKNATLEDVINEVSKIRSAVTDAVDDGMALARHWERRGVERFRPLAFDLFRFGVRVYHAHQPQFLNEFVLENVDLYAASGAFVGSPEMRAATLESLWLSLRAPRR